MLSTFDCNPNMLPTPCSLASFCLDLPCQPEEYNKDSDQQEPTEVAIHENLKHLKPHASHGLSQHQLYFRSDAPNNKSITTKLQEDLQTLFSQQLGVVFGPPFLAVQTCTQKTMGLTNRKSQSVGTLTPLSPLTFPPPSLFFGGDVLECTLRYTPLPGVSLDACS